MTSLFTLQPCCLNNIVTDSKGSDVSDDNTFNYLSTNIENKDIFFTIDITDQYVDIKNSNGSTTNIDLDELQVFSYSDYLIMQNRKYFLCASGANSMSACISIKNAIKSYVKESYENNEVISFLK